MKVAGGRIVEISKQREKDRAQAGHEDHLVCRRDRDGVQEIRRQEF